MGQKKCNCISNINMDKRFKHKLSGTRFYRIFHYIKTRCSNKKRKDYKYYGGKGIKIKWKTFIEFKNDMYKSYKEAVKKYPNDLITIERINNNKNYCKENCIWIPFKKQSSNQTSNHKITYKGQTKNLIDWSKELNINYDRLRRRLKLGWSTEKAFETKKMKNQFE